MVCLMEMVGSSLKMGFTLKEKSREDKPTETVNQSIISKDTLTMVAGSTTFQRDQERRFGLGHPNTKANSGKESKKAREPTANLGNMNTEALFLLAVSKVSASLK